MPKPRVYCNVAERRAADRKRKKDWRNALNEEQKAQLRAQNAARAAAHRAAMSEEKIKQVRAKNAARAAALRAQMSEEQRELERAKDAARFMSSKAAMNEEQKQQKRAKNAARTAAHRAAMRGKQSELQRGDIAACMRSAKASMNEEQRRKFKAAAAARSRHYRLIARTNTLSVVAKNPERYEDAGTFIKHSLREIKNLQEEVGHLKKELQQTVSEAVRNAVKLQRGEKCRVAELNSLSFVEIPLSLEAKINIWTIENMTDPLYFQPGEDSHPEIPRPSRENIEMQNQNDKTFKVFVHNRAPEGKSDNKCTTKKLECSCCPKIFGTAFGLIMHQKEHTVDLKEFSCSVCSDVFHTYNLLTTHYLQVHSFEFGDQINKKFEDDETDEEIERCLQEIDFLVSRKCFICFETFNSKLRLVAFSKHIIEQHRDNQYLLNHFTHICAHCNKPHSLLRSLEAHWKSNCFHKWKNQLKDSQEIVCEHCGTKFSNEKSLSSHVKINHEGTIICEQCGSQFRKESGLKSHIVLVHQLEYTFSCEHCERKFKTLWKLQEHIKVVHLGEKPFACKFCSRRFSKKIGLEFHENTHTGKKPYECKVCGKSYAAKSSLSAHEGFHDGYKCKICGVGCGNYVDLCIHRRVNHPDLTNTNRVRNRSKVGSKCAANNYQPPTSCEICGKSVKDYMALKYHKKSVHGERKYVCNICGKSYKTPNSIISHKYTHDNLQRFGCSLCGRKFRQATNFYQHKKVAHVNEKAEIVKLISETNTAKVRMSRRSSCFKIANKLEETLQTEQYANTEKTSDKTPAIRNSLQITASTISSYNVERGDYFSPGLDDYFSDIEFENQDNERANVPQLENAQSTMLSLDVQNTHLESETECELNSTDLKQTNFGKTLTDHTIPSCSKMIDFSRANVPLGFSAPLNDELRIEQVQQKIVSGDKINDRNEQQHKIFIEDSEDHTFMANLSTNDLVKLKTETLVDSAENYSVVNDLFESNDFDSENENEVQIKSEKVHFDEDLIKTGLKSVQMISSPHLVVKLTKLLEYKCNPCNKTIFALSQREIRQHSRTHIKHTQQKYFKCESKTKVKSESEIKVKSESKIKVKSKSEEKKSSKSCGKMRGPYKCLHCDKADFDNYKKVIDHCSKEHPGKQPFQCNICSKTFSKRKRLTNHKSRVHNKASIQSTPEEKPEFLCELCGKKFTTSYSVKMHVLNMHEERKFQCDVCSKLFFKMRELEKHKLRHSGIKPHLCEECGMSFFTPHELTDHVEQVHRKINKRKSRLVKKVEKKTSATHPFACNLCPYVFRKEIGLKSHLEMHDPLRKYSCDECGLRFKFSTNVVTHKEYKHKKSGKRNIIEVSANN